MTTAPDLIVVGGGPAGLAAAATALAGGLRVVLVDAGHALGGQYWRHPPVAPERVADLHHDLGTYAALTAYLGRAVRRGLADVRLAHHVWTVEHTEAGFRVHAVDRSRAARDRAVVLTAPALVVATGAHDRPLPFPGWDLPGVFTAGGLQAILKGGGSLAGRRVVVGGTGPFLLPVATGLAQRGATVVGVCEGGDGRGWAAAPAALAANPGKLAEGLGYAAGLARHRIPVRPRTAVVAAHGRERVEAVSLARLDGAGVPRMDTLVRVAVDAVGVSWGFVPQVDLAVTLGAVLTAAPDGNRVVAVDEWQRTTRAGLYAAGESCGVGGAELALREGQLAAEAVLRDTGRPGATEPSRLAHIRRIVERQRRFAAAMHRAHPVPAGWPEWLTASTTVCRCEEVDAALAERWGPAGSATDPAGAPAERLVTAPVTLGALAEQHERAQPVPPRDSNAM